MSLVELGIGYYPDPTQGRPVFNGEIYIGFPDTDPEIQGNQKPITLRQQSGVEVPGAQPVKTSSGGVPIFQNSPIDILVDGNYSLKVLNNKGVQVYYVPNSANIGGTGGSGLLITEEQTLADGQTEITFGSNLSNASVYVNNSEGLVDMGRMLESVDYSVDLSTNTITLFNSYPAGTVLTTAYNEASTSEPYVRYVDTVEDMKAQLFPVGVIVYTQGYTTAGDGGGGLYLSATPQATDGIIDHTADNGNALLLQDNKQILSEAGGSDTGIDSMPGILAAATKNNSGTALLSKDSELQTTLDITRYHSLSGVSNSSQNQNRVNWTGGADIAIQADSSQTYKTLNIDGGATVAGSTGMKLGRDINFEAYTTVERSWIQNFDTGIAVSNVFDTKLDQVRITDNNIGIHVDPVVFGDGGYVTTFTLNRVYVTDNAEEGLLSSSPIKNKMLLIEGNSVFEKNGDATHAQIDIGSGQVNTVHDIYIEDSTQVATAIKAEDGNFKNIYINGSNYGFDFGAGPCKAIIENVKFVNSASADIRATGGALVPYLNVKMCELSNAPDVAATKVIYDGSSGDMPAGIPEYSTVYTGTKPEFGIGSTPAILRDNEAHLVEWAGDTVNASSDIRVTVPIPNSRMQDGVTSLFVTAQTELTSGLTATIQRISDANARLVITNATTSNIVESATDFIVEVRRFSQIN